MAEGDRGRWDARYASHLAAPAPEPSAWLAAIADRLPRAGRAIDVAGGAGRHAVWLARRGLALTLVDVSPAGLAAARRRALVAGVALTTACRDLDREPPPPGPWQLALVVDYLNRPLLARLGAALAPGGMLVVCHPTRTNLERHARPSARFLLEPGELPTLVPGLQVVHGEEAWYGDRDPASQRHEAHLIATA